MSKTEEQKNPRITHQEGPKSHHRQNIAEGIVEKEYRNSIVTVLGGKRGARWEQ
jgi:hypothetical protein